MKLYRFHFDFKSLEFKEEVLCVNEMDTKNKGTEVFLGVGKSRISFNQFISVPWNFISLNPLSKRQKEKIINKSLEIIKKYTWMINK